MAPLFTEPHFIIQFRVGFCRSTQIRKCPVCAVRCLSHCAFKCLPFTASRTALFSVCRSLPLALRFSVSALEKIDTRRLLIEVGYETEYKVGWLNLILHFAV
jgi:hypothetical protein